VASAWNGMCELAAALKLIMEDGSDCALSRSCPDEPLAAGNA